MTDFRALYMTMTARQLKKIINNAVTEFDLDSGWEAPFTNDKTLLVDSIDELCNEHGLTPNEDGTLRRS